MTNSETLREAAVALRRCGKSRREIKEALGLGGNREVSRLLDGEPPPDWTRRPNAKDDLRERARHLRGQGWMYDEIVAEIGVAKSSVSLWTRDVSTPALEERKRQRSEEGEVRRLEALSAWQEEARRQRGIARQQTKFVAASEIGDLSPRDVLMVGAMAYWCEGQKDKPYSRREYVSFINSDRYLIRFFMRFLEIAGVEPERFRFRVHIHEDADIDEATRYWAAIVGVDSLVFQRPVVKRHNPKTRRKNLDDNYRGCLQVTVVQSAELYRKMEGWAFGAMLGGVRGQEASAPAGGSGAPGVPRRLRPWRRPRNPLPWTSGEAR